MSEVGHRGNSPSRIRSFLSVAGLVAIGPWSAGDDDEREPLVVAVGRALEFVEAGEATGGDGVELPVYATARSGEAEEKGDGKGTDDEGEAASGSGGAEEGGVAGGGEVREEGVVGEAALEGAVDEHESRPIQIQIQIHRLSYQHV